MRVRNYFNRPEEVGVKCGDGRTQRHFKDEVDINSIVRRFMRTGVLGDPFVSSKGDPIYGDVSEPVTLAEALRVQIAASEAFESLPASVRKRFGNDPMELLAFVSDRNNLAEARELGLVEPEGAAQLPLDVTVRTDTREVDGNGA